MLTLIQMAAAFAGHTAGERLANTDNAGEEVSNRTRQQSEDESADDLSQCPPAGTEAGESENSSSSIQKPSDLKEEGDSELQADDILTSDPEVEQTLPGDEDVVPEAQYNTESSPTVEEQVVDSIPEEDVQISSETKPGIFLTQSCDDSVDIEYKQTEQQEDSGETSVSETHVETDSNISEDSTTSTLKDQEQEQEVHAQSEESCKEGQSMDETETTETTIKQEEDLNPKEEEICKSTPETSSENSTASTQSEGEQERSVTVPTLDTVDSAGSSGTNGASEGQKDTLTVGKMPSVQDQEEEVGERSVSPSLMFASCRIRWAKTVVTQSDRIVFVTLNKKVDPIRLDWDNNSQCFYSDELRIGTGNYIGNLVIDGQFYPVEDVIIKHYTFEVDLYLKDDIIEDEVDQSGLTKTEDLYEKEKKDRESVDTYQDINTSYTSSSPTTTSTTTTTHRMADLSSPDQSINLSSKYQELVRSQMSHTKTTLESNMDGDADVEFSAKTDLLDMDSARRSPVGDDGKDEYMDGDRGASQAIDLGTVYSKDTEPGMSGLNRSLVEDDVELQENGSVHSSSRGTPQLSSGRGTPKSPAVDDVINNGQRMPIYSTASPVHSRNNSAHSSARQTPVVGDSHLDFKHGRSPENVISSPGQKSPLTDQINDIFNSQSPARSPENPPYLPQSPPREQIDDVLNPADRHSPIRRDYLMGTPPSSRQNSSQGSASGSTRQTPQKEFITDSLQAGAEKLYGQQDPRRSSSEYSANSSHTGGSRPQSLTSEQELTQYYEQCDTRRSPATGAAQSLPVIPGTSNGTQPRSTSASSLPAIGSQQRSSVERRNLTPDNHIRVPVGGTGPRVPLLPNRASPRTPASNVSSRTVTPTNPVDTKAEKITELEDTILTLRKLLGDKEQEVRGMNSKLQDIQDVNQSLQQELDHRRARSPGPQLTEWERKYNLVMGEKEILAGEVVKLQDELDRKATEGPSLSSYDPNNPYALQRKISEMKSQIQDLQEANESAVDEINSADKKIQDLTLQTESHRATHSSKLRKLEDENQQLRDEIKRAKEQTTYSFSEASEHRLRIELQQVKDDNRGLRERNYQLHDDNLKQKEELASLRKSLDVMEVTKKTFKDERKSRSGLSYGSKVVEKDKPLDGSYHSDRGGRDYSYTADILDKERDSLDRQWEREKSGDKENDIKKYRYRTRFDTKKETQRTNRVHESDSLNKLDSSTRYSSYRSVPDGGSAEKTTRPYDRPGTPERPSALGPSSLSEKPYSPASSLDRVKQNLYTDTYESSDRYRHTRSRTTSGERDFRSLPVPSAYSEMAKTVPALPERSRAIFKSISDLRSRSRSRSPGNRSRSRHYCEFSPGVTDHSDIQGRPAVTKITANRKTPKPKHYNRRADELPPRHSSGLSEQSYTRPSPPAHHRSHSTDPYREEKAYDVRPAVTSTYQDDGEMSDTPTDILVNAQPSLDRPKTESWRRSTRQRRGSAGSDGSGSSCSDIDEQIEKIASRKRSKSADSREILRRMAPAGVSSRSGTIPQNKTMDPKAGFRSHAPRPLVTQHNKSTMGLSPGTTSLTQGLRPYAPRSPADIQNMDVIKFSRQGGKLSQGTVKFIGHLPGRGDVYLGVELDKEDGKHDGTFEEIRYFKCKPNKGVFVAYNKVVMAWSLN